MPTVFFFQIARQESDLTKRQNDLFYSHLELSIFFHLRSLIKMLISMFWNNDLT